MGVLTRSQEVIGGPIISQRHRQTPSQVVFLLHVDREAKDTWQSSTFFPDISILAVHDLLDGLRAYEHIQMIAVAVS